MRVTPTALAEVLVIEPTVHRDARGFFLETWHRERYAAAGIPTDFVQDNHSRSARGTLRGLHAQRTRPQGKLVRAVHGSVLDVAVDIRRGSPTFGRWVGVELSSENFRQVWIPPGFAHGFCVTSDAAEIEYKCTDVWVAGDEITLLWSDPAIGIQWPLRDPVLSDKDRHGLTLESLSDVLPVWTQP